MLAAKATSKRCVEAENAPPAIKVEVASQCSSKMQGERVDTVKPAREQVTATWTTSRGALPHQDGLEPIDVADIAASVSKS